MRKVVLKRILSIPLILLVLSVMIFSLVLFLSPSERVAVFVSSSDALQNASLEELIKRYGLDQPFYIQYKTWIVGVLNGNLGWSNSAGMSISDALAQYVPATIELLLTGQAVVFLGGIFFGTLAARKYNRLPDHLIRVGTTLGISIPEFIISLFLLIVFYVSFDLFPPGRLGLAATDVVLSDEFANYSGLHLIDAVLNWRFDVFIDALQHLILPSIAYSLGGLAATVRLMRSSILENLSKGYVNTARLKGLKEKVVLKKHVRRNAMLPLITYTGMRVPVLLSGSVIVETIFNYPGMGLFIVTAALSLDFPAIIAASLAISIIIIVSNLIVDLLYSVLNPVIGVE